MKESRGSRRGAFLMWMSYREKVTGWLIKWGSCWVRRGSAQFEWFELCPVQLWYWKDLNPNWQVMGLRWQRERWLRESHLLSSLEFGRESMISSLVGRGLDLQCREF